MDTDAAQKGVRPLLDLIGIEAGDDERSQPVTVGVRLAHEGAVRRPPAGRRALLVRSSESRPGTSTVPRKDWYRVQHDGMTAKVARPHAFAGRLLNTRVITHDSHTATRPP